MPMNLLLPKCTDQRIRIKYNLMLIWDEVMRGEKSAARPHRFLRQFSLLPYGTACFFGSSDGSQGRTTHLAPCQSSPGSPRPLQQLHHQFSPGPVLHCEVLYSFPSHKPPEEVAHRSSQRTWPVPKADSADNLLNGYVNVFPFSAA